MVNMDNLLQDVGNGHVSILLGNGIDTAISGNNVGWSDLLLKLAEDLNCKSKALKEVIRTGNLLIAADYLSDLNEQDFNAKLKSRLLQIRWESTPERQLLMKLIAKLNPKYILTTNYTNVIQDGLTEIGFDTSKVTCDDEINNLSFQNNTPIIYLHGDLEKPVLRFADYFDHRRNNPKLWAYIATILETTSMMALGIELSESEFDIYETLIESRRREPNAKPRHFLFSTGNSDNIRIRATALESRFGLKIISEKLNDISEKLNDSYLNYYIEKLSSVIEKSPLPYIGVNTTSIDKLGLFCGLYTRNIIIYPKFTDTQTELSKQIYQQDCEQKYRLPNATIYNSHMVECIGGAASVAAATFSKLSLDNTLKNAVIFAKGPKSEKTLKDLGREIGVALDGVETSAENTISVIINNPNSRDMDERLILDLRDERVYDKEAAILNHPALTRCHIKKLIENCGLIYLDRWGSSWVDPIYKIIGRGKIDIPVLLDTGWTGGTIKKKTIEPEATFGKIVTHLIASLHPFKKYVKFIKNKSNLNAIELLKEDPVEIFSALKTLFPHLRFFSLTLGSQGTINCFITEGTQNSVELFEMPAISTETLFHPMNPLGCGDVWRGAFAQAILRKPGNYYFAVAIATMAAFWHIVGGIDLRQSLSLKHMGIPQSLPNWQEIEAFAQSDAKFIEDWKTHFQEKTGLDIKALIR